MTKKLFFILLIITMIFSFACDRRYPVTIKNTFGRDALSGEGEATNEKQPVTVEQTIQNPDVYKRVYTRQTGKGSFIQIINIGVDASVPKEVTTQTTGTVSPGILP